jgi:hypothetical protein
LTDLPQHLLSQTNAMAPSQKIRYPRKYSPDVSNFRTVSKNDSVSGYQALVALLDSLSDICDLVYRHHKSRTGVIIDRKQENKFSDTIVKNANNLTRNFKNAVEDAGRSHKYHLFHMREHRRCLFDQLYPYPFKLKCRPTKTANMFFFA